MIKKLSLILIGILGCLLFLPTVSHSQGDEAFRIKLESILSRFKNYRYSTIAIYRIEDIKDIRNAIKAADETLNKKNVVADAECVKNANANDVTYIQNKIDQGFSSTQIKRDMVNVGMILPDNFDCIYDQLAAGGETIKTIRNAYVVTTRMERGQLEPSSVIALIVTRDDEDDMSKAINRPAPKDIYTNPELFMFVLDPTEYRAGNMFELVMNAFRQNNIRNVTLDAQGFGTFTTFGPKVVGVTRSLINSESDITPSDVQSFMRISEGQPFDYRNVNNEIVISPDLISWRKYDVTVRKYIDGYVDTISNTTNMNLPKIGLELKYGIDEINYPSFWSERITASALWENVKLGLILPTNGWSSLSKDLFEVDRKLTHGGFGLAARMDFPIKVIPKSGVFNFSFGYVFGDAKESEYKNRKLDPDNFVDDVKDNDYLVRFNGTLLYTFGVAIDEDYMMRFGIGGTIFNMESWHNNLETNPDTGENSLSFAKKEDETIGGITGRFDFMAKNIATPYGATLQYFNESLFTNIWLQIPIVENTFALRLEAKGYFTAFKDAPAIWENESVFMPMARFIVTF